MAQRNGNNQGTSSSNGSQIRVIKKMLLMALVVGFAIPQASAPVQIKACSARLSDAAHVEYRLTYETKRDAPIHALVFFDIWDSTKTKVLDETGVMLELRKKSATIFRRYAINQRMGAFYSLPPAFSCLLTYAVFPNGEMWRRPSVQIDYYGHENWFTL
jgi:hypothetical protein